MKGNESPRLGDLLVNPDLLPVSCRTVRLRRGDVLFRQGEEARSIFLVRSGRLRILRDTATGMELIGEAFAGESVGEMALLDPTARATTVVALRPTELVQIDSSDFEALLQLNPGAGLGLLRVLGTRLKRLVQPGPTRRHQPPDNLIVVAGADAEDFASLFKTLSERGPTLVLTQGNTEHFSNLLATAEAGHRFVLANLDSAPPDWREALLRSSDLVLVWGSPTSDMATRGRALEATVQSLVPALVRPRFHAVFHHGNGPPYHGAESVLSSWPVSEWHHVSQADSSSFARLGRVLASEEITLVLGGGGARGLSHLGVLEEMEARGIPVDRIGGTSIGALVGGLYALHRDPKEVAALLRKRFADRSRKLHDYTFPIVSVIGARRYTRGIRKMFGDSQIENFPTDFFCVTCNLTQGHAVAHDTGLAWDWIVTSMSLPGFAPPRLHQGELLADGGVTENIPTRLALRRARGPLIAVDLCPVSDLRCDPSLTGRLHGWRALRHRLPNLPQILRRASVIQGDILRPAALARADLAIQPEVGRFGMFDWDRMDAIVEAGREAAKRALDQGWPLSPADDLPSQILR